MLLEYTADRAEIFSRFDAFIVPADPASGQLTERIPDRDEELEEFLTVRRIAGDWKVSTASFGPFREQAERSAIAPSRSGARSPMSGPLRS